MYYLLSTLDLTLRVRVLPQESFRLLPDFYLWEWDLDI